MPFLTAAVTYNFFLRETLAIFIIKIKRNRYLSLSLSKRKCKICDKHLIKCNIKCFTLIYHNLINWSKMTFCPAVASRKQKKGLELKSSWLVKTFFLLKSRRPWYSKFKKIVKKLDNLYL